MAYITSREGAPCTCFRDGLSRGLAFGTRVLVVPGTELSLFHCFISMFLFVLQSRGIQVVIFLGSYFGTQLVLRIRKDCGHGVEGVV